MTQHTDRKSQFTNYTYDSLDRLSQITYADSSTISYTYDGVGRLTQVTDSISGTITYAYDNLDRLLSETTGLGTVSYTYDAVGRRATMSVPGQSVVNYAYDNANRLTQITQGTSTVTIGYDNADRRTSLTLPNGVVTEYAYDVASQLVSLAYNKAGNTLGNLTYEYDSAGHRVRIGGSFARTNLPAALTSAGYNTANQQTAFGGQMFSYDLNGNLTGDGTNTYTWNARDELVSISGSVAASFQYDAVGRRRGKTIGGTNTNFLYDGANIVQEQVGGSASANTLTGRVDQLFTRTDASGSMTALSDGIGSNIALADSTGVVQTQYTYEPFGETTETGAGTTNSQKYTSREDDGTGLYYYRARYYSPTLQRFIGEDPIEFGGGDINLYAYVGNNPISFSDRFGLQHPYEQITHNAAKMGPPPLGGRSCGTAGNRDVEVIFETYRRRVDQLTEEGKRHRNAYWNNFSSYWNGYLGCGQQAGRVITTLRSLPKGSLEDEWTFEFEATPFADFHVWGRGTSKNPSHPDIVFDPWHDEIYCEPHGTRQLLNGLRHF